MRDEHKPGAAAAALLIALLMAVRASAAGGDPGLVAAARSQDAPRVRALLKQRVSPRMTSACHLIHPEDTPLTNLQLTLLNQMGVPAEKLGDSTGRFTELSGLTTA